MDRRDAAVAGALAGGVVVILGYAAGLGIVTPGAVAAQPPVQPAYPVSPVAPSSAPPVGSPAPAYPAYPAYPVYPTPTTPAATTPVGSPTAWPSTSPTSGAPSTPPTTEPTASPTPSPTDPPPTCDPGPLGGLPLVGPVTEAATSLLSTVVNSVPVVDQLVGGLVGCPAATAARTDAESGR